MKMIYLLLHIISVVCLSSLVFLLGWILIKWVILKLDETIPTIPFFIIWGFVFALLWSTGVVSFSSSWIERI